MTKGQLAKLEDHDLVHRVAEGDVRAFEAIYDRYSTQAYGLALRVTGHRGAAEEAKPPPDLEKRIDVCLNPYR